MIRKSIFPACTTIPAQMAAHPLHTPYTALVARLRSTLPSEGGAVGVTSTLRGEGVSSVAANVAICAARCSHESVLLVDLHPQDGAVARLLRVQANPGLADLLRHEADFESCVQRTSIENLSALTVGSDALETTSSVSALAAVVEELKQRYAFIVCDLPPVAVQGSSLVVAGQLDGVVLVAEAGQVQGESVKRASEQIKRSGARLLGVVLNKRVEKLPVWLE